LSDKRELLALLSINFGIIAFISGFGTLLVQAFVYLKYGIWKPWSGLSFIEIFGISWTVKPESWLGLHNALSWLSLSGLFFIVGGLAFLFALTHVLLEKYN
jgi:hypothetical protein